MGSSVSKAPRAAGAAARQYPSRLPQTSPAATNTPPDTLPTASNASSRTTRQRPQAASQRSEAIDLDASDPDFARSLRSLGPVQPNPTLSQTSVFPHPANQNAAASARPAGPDPRQNPAIAILDARARLQDEAEKEFMDAGRKGHEGRQFIDVFTIRQMLTMRDEKGRTAAEIERVFGLKKGVVARLGAAGVVSVASEQGRARKEVDVV